MSIGANTKMLRSFGARFMNVIREFDTRYSDEIEGIAEGCGLEPYAIYCLNARTEISLQLLQRCSEMPSNARPRFLQRRDSSPELGLGRRFEKLAVISEIRTKEHAILTMHEPGMLAKTGMNSTGIGVCLNALHIPKDWKKGDLNVFPACTFVRFLIASHMMTCRHYCSNVQRLERQHTYF